MDCALLSFFDPAEDDEAVEDSPISEAPRCLPPEPPEGNIEYKLKLMNPSKSRFDHLATQMKWRLEEGCGEAIYEIGVEDNGVLAGLTALEMKTSLDTLHKMADEIGATLTVVREDIVCEKKGPSDERHVAEILVRKSPEDQQFADIRLAVLGQCDAGKSSLIGTLTSGNLDNGRGSSRLNMFRHLHEIITGRTSSISHDFIGFDSGGKVVTWADARTPEEICTRSTKVITFVDLAGHEKYQKTTIFGLVGYWPDAVLMVASAGRTLDATCLEHLGLALAFDIPIIFVVNKVDLVDEASLQRTTEQLNTILESDICKKIPFIVETEDQALTAAKNFPDQSFIPIFTTSCVSGKNLDLLQKFLHDVPLIKSAAEREALEQEMPQFHVDETFRVPDVGIVMSGSLTSGVIQERDVMLLGPCEKGRFTEVRVKSLHRNRTPCRVARAGHAATVAIADFNNSVALRKGLVLLSSKVTPVASLRFEASIFILYHSASIGVGFKTTVYAGTVRQTAVIESMDKERIQTDERAVVVFRFCRQPEYLQEGARFLCREANSKGIGQVMKMLSDSTEPNA